MVTYTTTDLLEGIRRTAHIPVSNETFLPPALLAIADTCMRTVVTPAIAGTRENYWVTYKDYQIENGDEINRISIPSLTIGEGIITAKLLQDQFFLDLDRIEIAELTSTQFSPRPLYGYYMEDNVMVLLPNGGINGTVRVWYQRIPSKLVPTSECAQVDSVAGDDVTVVSLPNTFTTETELDICSAAPGFNVLKKDSDPTAINNLILTFDDVPQTVKVGDWVCLSGQSCVVQAPLEWIEVLVQACAVKIYEIQGYLQKMKAAQADLDRMIKMAVNVVSPRQVQNTKYITAGGGVLGIVNDRWPYPVGRRD